MKNYLEGKIEGKRCIGKRWMGDDCGVYAWYV